MFTMILLGLILSYAVYIMYRKIKAMKAGNFCGGCSGGGCSNCPSANKKNDRLE